MTVIVTADCVLMEVIMDNKPTLLETFITSLQQANIDPATIRQVSGLAEIWIDTLRENPYRLSRDELTLLAQKRVADKFQLHFDTLWALIIDPDQEFGRIGVQGRPMLL